MSDGEQRVDRPSRPEPATMRSSWAVRGRKQIDRSDLALAFLFLTIVAPFVQTIVAQNAIRYSLTAALTERGTFQLDEYDGLLSIDYVELDGHLYADKAPGQPVLGVPILAAAEALGAEPATETRFRGNLGAWSQQLAFCAVPGALLLVLMRRHASRRASRATATTAAMALSFGTLLLPFASTLYAHLFVATLAFAAWHLLTRADASTVAVAGAGVLSAVAVTAEYPMAAVSALLTIHVLHRFGIARTAVFVAPHVVAAALLIAYNLTVFSSPASGYTAKSDGGRLNFVGFPDPGNVVAILTGQKGLIFTPIVLVGIVGLVRGLRDRRWDLLVPLGVVGGFFALQAGWSNPWGGEAPGPRYLTPALPFLVAPVALVLPRLTPVVRRTFVGVGVASMSLTLLTIPLLPEGAALIAGHLHNIDRFGINPTVFTIAFGDVAGWLVHGTLVAFAAWTFVRSERARRLSSPRRRPGAGP